MPLFMGKQRQFVMQATAIPRHFSLGTDDTMAGNDEAKRIPSHGSANRLGGHLREAPPAGNCLGQFTICHRLPKGNLQHKPGDLKTELARPAKGMKLEKVNAPSQE